MNRPAEHGTQLGSLLESLGAPRSAYRPLPTSLTDAALRGDLTAAQLHLDQGANLRQRTIGFASPLHAACGQGHLDMARFLFGRGAPLQAGGEMFTCIHFAAGKGYTEIVRWALDAGFPPAKAASALSAAAVGGHYETVKVLLEHGVGRERARAYGWGQFKRTPADRAEAAGFTALATFIRGGTFDAEEHARQVSAAGEAADDLGIDELPLDPVRRQSVRAIVLEEIRALSNPDQLDKEGVPLLVRAVITCDPLLVRALLDRGADPNIRAEFAGLTALTQACALGQREIAEMLLARGAGVNNADGSGKTPLMHAVARGEPEMVELLLGAGADTRAKDLTGRTALKHRVGPYADRIALLLKARGKSRRQPRESP